MEDRRHTEPWRSARPSEASGSGNIPTGVAQTGLSPTVAVTDDERLRGFSIDGRFKIEDWIGTGGMSRVYSGHHVQTGVRVAIKLIDPALSRDSTTKQRLLGEARAMMELQSNHIVRALDAGALPSGQLYVVMDYIPGDNLDAVLAREGPLPWPRVAAIGMQICDGLATAHRSGIIHRDIKPQNCILTKIDEGREHIRIIDFGLARDVAIEAGLTEQGILPGTPEYLAPELAKRQVRANERSDIYAVGVTLYKLLTGYVPFQGATYMDTLYRHAKEPLVLPSVAAPDRVIPSNVDDMISRALDKDPERRFSSADEMARALHAVLDRSSRTTQASGFIERLEYKTSHDPRVHSAVLTSSVPSASGPRGSESSSTPKSDLLHAMPRTLNARFVLLRVSTLMVVSALFAVGTFLLRPRAETPKSPVAATKASAAHSAALSDISRSSAQAREVTMAVDPAPETTASKTSSIDAVPRADTSQLSSEFLPGDMLAAARPGKELLDEPSSAVADAPIAVDPELLPESVMSPTDDDQPAVIEPQLPLEPTSPSEAAARSDLPPTPESKFDYAGARTELEDQHVYLRNECMGNKAQKPLHRLKFRVDVRADGRPTVSVFSGEKAVRSCVRYMFRFYFDRSPRGGAFEYILTMTTHTLKPVPVDPEKAK